MLTLREPTNNTTPLRLGTITASNPGTFRRRAIVATSLPLNSGELQAGDAITVMDPGTGRNELAEVTSNWCTPYAASQRVVRVAFPAVLGASNQAQTWEAWRSGSGLGGSFVERRNVTDALVAAEFRFFAGPKATHYVVLKAAGAALPSPVASSHLTRTYRWFGRIYEPGHAPGLRTQMFCRLEIDVHSDMDYVEWRRWWGVCDPRLDEPNGWQRAALTDEETEVGLDVVIDEGVRLQPVVWFPERSLVGQSWLGDRWRTIDDRRLVYSGQPMNDTLPWGTMGATEGVFLCYGPTGNLGDQLRQDSLDAWVAWPYPVTAVSDDWLTKQSAYAHGSLPRPFKRHEHYDRNRDFAWVQNKLRQEALDLVRIPSNARAYLWDRGNAQTSLFYHEHGSVATGAAGSWRRLPHWIALAYRVPDLALVAERCVMSQGFPYYFVEANGELADAFAHPNLHIDLLNPGLSGLNGDMLGKTSLQAWRTSRTANMIRTPLTLGGSVGPPNEPPDDAHCEQPWPFAHAAVFGSKMSREIARALFYVGILGDWQPSAWTVGNTGQPRALARGLTMHGWGTWLFAGEDSRLYSRMEDVFIDHVMEPAQRRIEQAQPEGLGLAPYASRLHRDPTALRRASVVGPDRVDLEDNEYSRGWETCHAAPGVLSIINCVGPHNAAVLAYFTQYMRDLAVDVFRMGTPRIVDESTGRILQTFLRPTSVGGAPVLYEPAAATAIVSGGTRKLSWAEIQTNNWSNCGMTSHNCAISNRNSFMRLGGPNASTGAFTLGLGSWIAELEGAVGDIPLVRYVHDFHSGRAGIPNDVTYASWIWLNDVTRWAIGIEWVYLNTSITSRGTIAAAPSGFAVASDNVSAWVTVGTSLRRVSIANGTGTTYTPALSAAWSGVAAHGGTVALLDGAGDRSTVRLYVTTEATPNTGTTRTVTLPGTYAVQGLTWDVNTGGYLACGYANGRSVVLRIPASVGDATIAPDVILHEDFDTPASSIATTTDGRLLAVANAGGRVWVHPRARGGYWGPPRASADRGGWLSFTRHARTDDALRLVAMDTTGRMTETEV